VILPQGFCSTFHSQRGEKGGEKKGESPLVRGEEEKEKTGPSSPKTVSGGIFFPATTRGKKELLPFLLFFIATVSFSRSSSCQGLNLKFGRLCPGRPRFSAPQKTGYPENTVFPGSVAGKEEKEKRVSLLVRPGREKGRNRARVPGPKFSRYPAVFLFTPPMKKGKGEKGESDRDDKGKRGGRTVENPGPHSISEDGGKGEKKAPASFFCHEKAQT